MKIQDDYEITYKALGSYDIIYSSRPNLHIYRIRSRCRCVITVNTPATAGSSVRILEAEAMVTWFAKQT